MGCCSSYTPIISPFKTTIFTEVTIFPAQNEGFRRFIHQFSWFFHPFLNAVGFPVQSQPETLYSMSNALSSKTTAVAVMMDATRQDQSTAGAISCATGKKGEKRQKKGAALRLCWLFSFKPINWFDLHRDIYIYLCNNYRYIHIMLYIKILYYIILYYVILYYIIVYYIILYYISLSLSLYLSVCLSIYLFTYLPICCTYLSVCLSTIDIHKT